MTHTAMTGGLQSPARVEGHPCTHRTVRTLQIEDQGDHWKGISIPKIRLMGRWLEQAGFPPGHRVQITCVAPGVIELRAPGALSLNETKPPAVAPDDDPS